MDMSDIAALAEMLSPEGEEELVSNPNKGSIFGPGDIGGKGEKEVAKPFAQVEVKGGRGQQQPQQQEVQKQQQPAPAKLGKNDIWSAEEVHKQNQP
jgi:hypothetical protein